MKSFLVLSALLVFFTKNSVNGRLDLTPEIEEHKPSVGFCIGEACSTTNNNQGQSDDPNAVNDEPLDIIPDCQAHNESHFVAIEDKIDCHSYYTCSNGTLDHHTCPENLAYNPNMHLCVHQVHVKGCKKPIDCSQKDGVIADPGDCTKYVNCVYGFPHRFQCSHGTSFDELSGHCRITSEECGSGPDSKKKSAAIKKSPAA